MKKVFKGVLAVLLSLEMSLMLLGDSVLAVAHEGYMQKSNVTEQTCIYESDGIVTSFSVTGAWDGGYNALVKVSNLTEGRIDDWKLELLTADDIVNIWNARVLNKNADGIEIGNDGWNQDIEPASSIEFGYSSNSIFSDFPEIKMIPSREADISGERYSFRYVVTDDWSEGFNGKIEISNNSDNVIEEWQLSFEFENEIHNIWNAEIISHIGDVYIVKGKDYNQNIRERDKIDIGFTVVNGVSSNEVKCISLSEQSDTAYPIILSVDKSGMIENNYLNLYFLTEGYSSLHGTLNNVTEIKEFSYAIKDSKNSVIERGDIPVSEIWRAENVGFAIGYNEITIMAKTKSGDIVEEIVNVFNLGMDNISQNIDLGDDDEDGILNFLEDFYGTDRKSEHSDDDQVNDFIEIMVLGTDPLKEDSDNNGIWDGEEDFDEDGLSNLEEIALQTKPCVEDTDKDGILDGYEINIYGTNPLDKDTDGDYVLDGEEIRIQTNPLLKEELFDAVASVSGENGKVFVEAKLLGEQYYSLSVERYYNDFLFPDDMVGSVSGVYDFKVNGSFDKATIYFEFDDELLNDEFFDPAIYYFDEEEQLLEELPTSVVGNVASAEVTHFSKYILMNRKEYEASFEWIDEWVDSEYANVEIVFVIDDSSSMRTNDSYGKRIDVVKTLIDKLPNDSKIGIIRFGKDIDTLTWNEENQSGLTTNRLDAKLYLSNQYFQSNQSYTYMYGAINEALKLYDSSEETTLKLMVVLSDGSAHDLSKHMSTIKEVSRRKVKVYSVGLGGTNTNYFSNYLSPLASDTGGSFYFAANADQLAEIYVNIQRKIDIETDGDEDGIPDYYEDNFPMFNGKSYALKKDNPDTDEDTIPDGEEVQLRKIYNADGTKIRVVGKVLSDPCDGDRDHDGIPDKDDPYPLEHFGILYSEDKRSSSLVFKTTTNIEMPKNSYHEQEIAWEKDGHTYQEAFNERAARAGVDINNEEKIKIYIEGIMMKALMLEVAGGTLTGDGYSNYLETIDNIMVFDDIDGIGHVFLRHYLSGKGEEIQYNAKGFLTNSADGKKIYKKCVELAMKACENGTAKDGCLVFSQVDGAVKDYAGNMLTEQYFTLELINDFPHVITTVQQWLSLNQTFSAVSGKCTYDGDYYNLDLIFFLQDYYDWYYPKESNGLARLLTVTCDEMCWLHLYGIAKNYKDTGIYRVNIKWKKGEDYAYARQESYKFEAFQY